MTDLKRVYTASTEEIALLELEAFAEKWDSKHPTISKSWNENKATLSTNLKYTTEV